MVEERTKSDDKEKVISRAKMTDSPNSQAVGASINSKSEDPDPNDYSTKKTNYAEATANGGNKGRSCKGCLYYSSQFKSTSRNPLCVGVSRSTPNALNRTRGEFSKHIFLKNCDNNYARLICLGFGELAPRYIVGKSEMEASKEGKVLRDFKYGCIGYSLYPDQKNQTSNPQQTEPELPVCIGLEILVDRKIKDSLSDGNRLPQHRAPQPSNATRDEFLSRFSRNANLIANGVVKNMRRVGNQIKQSIDDIVYPYRKRPK